MKKLNRKIKILLQKKKELINFSTFSKHLYLKDKDFLYAKRVGGPVDFVLCTYQDINPKAKKLGFGMIAKGKKLLPSLKKKNLLNILLFLKILLCIIKEEILLFILFKNGLIIIINFNN